MIPGRKIMNRATFMLVALFATVGVMGSADAQNKCQGAKIKDAAKKAACVAGLEAKRVSTGTPIDSDKLAKCQAKLSTAYGKLEGKGKCNTTGDAGAIEDKVDAFVADLVSALDVAPTTTSTTLPMNCPGPPCASFGGGCAANADCCSNNCELSGLPPFCGVAMVPGGCCQTPDDCSTATTCSGGRCECVPNGGSCASDANCCSNNCFGVAPGQCQSVAPTTSTTLP
jgi:hypothetical protein